MSKPRLAPWLAVVVAGLGYPIVVLAGGGAHFPSRGECVRIAHDDGDLKVVFGRTESASYASSLLDRVLKSGFKGSQIEPDGCGLLEVSVHGIPSLEVGGEVVAEAKTVGLGASVETVTG
jgi:hypothetical protein